MVTARRHIQVAAWSWLLPVLCHLPLKVAMTGIVL